MGKNGCLIFGNALLFLVKITTPNEDYTRDGGRMLNKSHGPQCSTFLRPCLRVVPVHQVAAVRLHPALDTTGQNQGFHVGLAYLVEIVLHPARRSGTAPIGASCALLENGQL